ncbi:MAG: ankyrin repeat domain-containing protein, partial [Candidatus Babeliales bacterium]
MTTINELCKAIQENNLEKVKQLLAQGINIDLYSDSEENPIWVAVENGSLKIVKLLLENALFENHLNKQKIAFSALWHVTTKEHCSIIKFLLEDTALDLKNHPDYYRKLNDALKYAASVDRFDIFKLFIEYRAPVT